MARRPGYNDKFTAREVISALPGTGGVISTLAKRLGCTWSTAKRYVEQYPTIKAAYEDECERVKDMAESVILKGIEGGNTADAKWYLARKAKERGYSDRHEITGPDGSDISVNIVWADFNDGQL